MIKMRCRETYRVTRSL